MTNNWGNHIRTKITDGNPVYIYIAINLIVALAVNLLPLRQAAVTYLTFPPEPILWPERFYTAVTHLFVHTDIFLLLFNSLLLYWMGSLLLDFTRNRQFHFIYLGGGIAGALFYGGVTALFPALQPGAMPLMGAYTAVISVMAAVATLVPNYSVPLLIIGMVRVKFIVLFYIAINLAAVIAVQPAIGAAHVAAALFGVSYIKLLQNGTDVTAIFKRKPKLKVVHKDVPKKTGQGFNQREIDAILDKISQSGYDKLSKAEKDTLFRASKDQ